MKRTPYCKHDEDQRDLPRDHDLQCDRYRFLQGQGEVRRRGRKTETEVGARATVNVNLGQLNLTLSRAREVFGIQS